jgi:hypothetical protein
MQLVPKKETEVQTIDDEAILDMQAGDYGERAEACPDKDRLVTGAVVAWATVAGWVDHNPGRGQGDWFAGPCGWVLVDVIALPIPVPCRGYQKLWTVPAEVCKEIYHQLDSIRREIEEAR